MTQFGEDLINSHITSYFSYFIIISREERRLTLSENRVLRRIFGPERDEVAIVEKTAQ